MSQFTSMSPEQIRRHRETVLLRLLIRTAQIETGELVGRLHALGHKSVRPSYIGLLGWVDTEGTRLVALAERMGTTRQAASQLVTEIEKKGFLERRPDPDDGRAVLVRHTAAGRKLLIDALEQMAEIEAAYEEQVGAARFKSVKSALTAIADEFDPSSALGR